MEMSHNITWIAAAILATALTGGCDRNYPSAETAGIKPDGTAERAGEKRDQAVANIKQKAERAGDKLDDAAKSAKVKAALIGEPGLRAQIKVDTANGVVTLTGAVDTPQSLDRATQLAQAVQGVKSVDNCLNVKSKA